MRIEAEEKRRRLRRASPAILAVGLVLALVGCGSNAPDGSFPVDFPEDFSRVKEFAEAGHHRFRFPLDGLADRSDPVSCPFCRRGGPPGEEEYHAAEDYPAPPGTPVYAMADGVISFSGRAGGYGWLVSVDHPKANLYSLYGHLSPSRERRRRGPVRKGDLLAYLGDPDENGGSKDEPLPPHLHFGVRAGLRSDYPGAGEWRWQAGWIRPLPTGVGWLRPSVVINAQHVPSDGYRAAEGDLLEVWGVEMLLVSSYVVGGLCLLLVAVRRRKPSLLLVAAAACLAAGWLFGREGMQLTWIVQTVAALLIAAWILQRLRTRRRRGSTAT